MGLSSVLFTATNGLNTVETALQWRTDNVTNASTANYSRRDPTTLSTGTHGVTVTIDRANDPALNKQFLTANSASSASATTNSLFTQVASVFGTSQSTPYLSQAMDNFTGAWKAFQTDASSSTSEAQVVSTGQALAKSITTAYSQLTTIVDETQNSANNFVTTLNGKLTTLSAVNKKISADTTSATTQPELLDQRDQLVSDISGLVGVNVVAHPDGSVALYSNTGIVLVDSEAEQFQWNNNNSNANGITGPYISLAGTLTPSLNTSITGGSLGATINLLSTDATSLASPDPNVGTLGKAKQQLDNVAYQLADASGPNSDGNTFEGAYDAATADRTTDLNTVNGLGTGFFTIDATGVNTPAESLMVDANLVAGKASVKREAATAVIAQLTATTRAAQYPNATNVQYTANPAANTAVPGAFPGVTADGVTYSGLVTAISGYQTDSQAASTDTKTRLTATTTTLQASLSSVTGVNLDNEMAQITVLQNAYSANAKVISTVQAMFDALMNIPG